ncbi:MAG TPA: glycine zipper 2TM domain-containing protein [Steroidobacteraceae bacterium]|jgi:uncharacterized protein YcfJ|nr:glycine zipper 2TM domain-containing protein [Steroidobacteraceae bacterium]
MNKSLLIGLIVGVGVTAGVGALGLAFKGHQQAQPQMAASEQLAASADESTPAEAANDSTSASLAPEEAAPAAAPAEQAASGSAKPVRTAASYARVVSVEPQTRTITEPREVCNDVEVTKQAPVKDEHQIAGTVIGGVVGAVVGNQIGSGKGRKIAKVAGAVGGAYAGNKIQERIQNSRTVTETEKKCETVNELREVPDGYRVTYEWNGSTRTVHMDSDPGKRLPVRNGNVVLTAAR